MPIMAWLHYADHALDPIRRSSSGSIGAIADNIPPLTGPDLQALHRAAADMDWRAIDPTIFGTLFERGLGSRRAALGAHYTDTGTIAKLIDPLIRAPLLNQWQATHAQISAAKSAKAKDQHYQRFLLRLAHYRVLDPACGSGNFLYLALKALRDVEKQAQIQAQELGLQAEISLATGPHNILGLEINEFAAELARVTVWIGDIQWCRQNGWPHSLNPILKPLDGIAHRDALLNADGSEAVWPVADVIVGNPPFIGDKKMRSELGDTYVETLRKTYEGRVPGGADLVCYWFEKARAQIATGQLQAAGLVSTNSIRGGANRKVLERIADSTRIFLAWSDEPWVNDGAAVRVSMVGFGQGEGATLNGQAVAAIYADLTAAEGVNLAQAQPLAENTGVSFIGTQKSGSFDLPGATARKWLKQPNPNGKPNSEVVKPWANGQDVTRRPSDTWIVDFGTKMVEAEASLFELPFGKIKAFFESTNVRKTASTSKVWWRHERPRPDMRAALQGLPRFIATPRVAKHRVFAWLPVAILPDCQIVVIARADDATFGILHSRFHELWSLRMGTSLEDRPRYTPSTCFETYPFPEGLTPRDTARQAAAAPACMLGEIAAANIAAAARHLNQLRDQWLNPPEWTDWHITAEEEKAGFPPRPVAKPGFEADLKKRSLTQLYNSRPAWLTLAHQGLDAAVAAAYGWDDYSPAMADEEILRRLLQLNLERSAGH